MDKAPPPTLNIRIPKDVRYALDRAAREDQRRVTDMARTIIIEWLLQRGLLKRLGPRQ